MLRKRRKSKYGWMPAIGLAHGGTYRSNLVELALTAQLSKNTKPSAGTAGLQYGPLIPDYTNQYDGAFDQTLKDLTEGQDWLCKRIVGKIHLFCVGTGGTFSNSSDWGRVCATFGLFVCRAEDDAPADPDLDDDEIDPGNLQNIRQPWMFRRTWTFTNPTACTTSPQVYGQAAFNDNMNSVGEAGPHIDVRVARRIRKEERLFYAFSLVGADVGIQSVAALSPQVHGQVDLRFLGAMRRQSNKSTF